MRSSRHRVLGISRELKVYTNRANGRLLQTARLDPVKPGHDEFAAGVVTNLLPVPYPFQSSA